jgi:hypothetical protein
MPERSLAFYASKDRKISGATAPGTRASLSYVPARDRKGTALVEMLVEALHAKADSR